MKAAAACVLGLPSFFTNEITSRGIKQHLIISKHNYDPLKAVQKHI